MIAQASLQLCGGGAFPHQLQRPSKLIPQHHRPPYGHRHVAPSFDGTYMLSAPHVRPALPKVLRSLLRQQPWSQTHGSSQRHESSRGRQCRCSRYRYRNQHPLPRFLQTDKGSQSTGRSHQSHAVPLRQCDHHYRVAQASRHAPWGAAFLHVHPSFLETPSHPQHRAHQFPHCEWPSHFHQSIEFQCHLRSALWQDQSIQFYQKQK